MGFAGSTLIPRAPIKMIHDLIILILGTSSQKKKKACKKEGFGPKRCFRVVKTIC